MDFCALYSFDHEQQTNNKLLTPIFVGINVSSCGFFFWSHASIMVSKMATRIKIWISRRHPTCLHDNNSCGITIGYDLNGIFMKSLSENNLLHVIWKDVISKIFKMVSMMATRLCFQIGML